MYEFICVLFLFKQNSTRESNRRVVLRERVSVPTAGIGQIGGAYLRERRISLNLQPSISYRRRRGRLSSGKRGFLGGKEEGK